MKACYNCGCKEISNYCPECGQKVNELDVSFLQFLKEFMGDIFSFDSRAFNTFKILLLKPGFLSQEYAKGLRQKYVYPFRMYVFISIICFTLLSLISFNKETIYTLTPYTYSNGIVKFIELKKSNGIIRIGITGSGGFPENPADINHDGSVTNVEFERFIAENPTIYEKYQKQISEIKNSNNNKSIDIDIFSFMSKCIILLLPIFALILKLFHFRTTYLNQIVFLMHNHIFVLIIFSIVLLLSTLKILPANPLIIILTLFIISSIYIIKSSVTFFSESIPKTLMKFCLSFISYIGVFWVVLNVITISYMAFGRIYEIIFFG